MYNTNYKCVKPFDVWLDAIGPDGKKIPYRVERGTIWHLEWCGEVTNNNKPTEYTAYAAVQ